MRKFNINQELYDLLRHTDESTAFGLGLGLGKTESMKQYLYDISQLYPTRRILIIENNIENLEDLQKDLGDYVMCWHSKQRTHQFDDVLDAPRLAITKSKFFQLLVHHDYDILNNYDEYFWDEFSGLSPLTVSELVSDFETVAKQITKTRHTEYALELTTYFQDLINLIKSRMHQDNITYQISLDISLKEKAKELLDLYFQYNMQLEQYTLKLDVSVLIILQAIYEDTLWMSRYSLENKSARYAIAVCNDQIKEFLKNKKVFILDATAYFNKATYDYLNIKIYYDFKDNLISYDDLTIHMHHINGILPKDIRKGKTTALKSLISKMKDATIETFVPKNAIDPIVKKFGISEDKLYYFFSGKDIGSNDLRNITEMNIVAMQTYPKIMRVVYNHKILGMSLKDAQHPHKDIAELQWMSRNIAQLIGRTAIRQHNGYKVDIHMYVVNSKYIYFLQETFFTGCNIIMHQEVSNVQKKALVILTAIETRLEIQKTSKYIDTKDIFENHCKDTRTITKFCTNHKDKLILLANKYSKVYDKPRGKPPIYTEK